MHWSTQCVALLEEPGVCLKRPSDKEPVESLWESASEFYHFHSKMPEQIFFRKISSSLVSSVLLVPLYLQNNGICLMNPQKFRE